ncbi:MAG: recombination protein RecR [Deltaproteobacteria bacterium]|nr:recombination protein RecR [Deltaproteobacteria bacterium]
MRPRNGEHRSATSEERREEARAKDPIARLVQLLGKLPGIGEKTATRLALHIVRADPSYASSLADALVAASQQVHMCERCMNLTAHERCVICQDARRDGCQICVVEQPSDVIAIERTNEFRGLYHVLHGSISPLDGVGPDQIRIRELLERLSRHEEKGVSEIIVATNPSVDGEATALYLLKVLSPTGIKLTRIASGLPIGADLEYADAATISRALSARREMG